MLLLLENTKYEGNMQEITDFVCDPPFAPDSRSLADAMPEGVFVFPLAELKARSGNKTPYKNKLVGTCG